MRKLDELGFNAACMVQIQRMMRVRAGLFLVGGQTGSGRTTTLSAIMCEIAADVSRKAIAIENSPEYLIDGVTRYAVPDGDYVKAMRACMQIDPDVVMIGEIRDEASLVAALALANSGHQVWSSIHVVNPSMEEMLSNLKTIKPDADKECIRGAIWQGLNAEGSLIAEIVAPVH